MNLDLYDYSKRFMDPQIGRFTTIDKLATNFPWWTPYQYAGNTPVWAVDLDGLEPLFSTNDFYQALRQGESTLHGPIQAERLMDIYQKGASEGAMTGLSFSFSAIRLTKIGISAATVKNFNTTKAAFEVLGIEMPMLIEAVSSSVGGKMKGSNVLSMGLNEEGFYKAANIVDLISDFKSIYKGAAKGRQELFEGISSGAEDVLRTFDIFRTDSPITKRGTSNISEVKEMHRNSNNELKIMTKEMQKDEKDEKDKKGYK